jgi:disulfide bond formation protein DsbB
MNSKSSVFLFSSWVIALAATLGSLFFSEVMKLPPCVLCWYQRIAMYPLVLLYLVSYFTQDRNGSRYTFPLVIVGLAVSVYHNLLYYRVLPESASPCVQGISCTTVQLEWLGFITIPLLSFSAFTLLGILSLLMRRSYEK